MKKKLKKQPPINHYRPHITIYINGLTRVAKQKILTNRDQSKVTTVV